MQLCVCVCVCVCVFLTVLCTVNVKLFALIFLQKTKLQEVVLIVVCYFVFDKLVEQSELQSMYIQNVRRRQI